MSTHELSQSCRPLAVGLGIRGILALALLFSTTASAQDQSTVADANIVRLTLQQDLSSKLPNGSPFSTIDGAGKVYTGYIATKKAKWFHGLVEPRDNSIGIRPTHGNCVGRRKGCQQERGGSGQNRHARDAGGGNRRGLFGGENRG